MSNIKHNSSISGVKSSWTILLCIVWDVKKIGQPEEKTRQHRSKRRRLRTLAAKRRPLDIIFCSGPIMVFTPGCQYIAKYSLPQGKMSWAQR